MKNMLIVSLFLFSCGSSVQFYEPPETICEKTEDIPTINDKNICATSILCTTGNVKEYYQHFCICDKMCFCGHAKFQLSEECVSPEDKNCYKNNFISFLPGEFCTLNVDDREKAFSEMRKVLGK